MEMDIEFQSMFEKMLPTSARRGRMVVRDARKVLFAQGKRKKLIDKEKIYRTAIDRVEQSGSFSRRARQDRWAQDKTHGPDVSRQGVQRDLLPSSKQHRVHQVRPGKDRSHPVIAAGAFIRASPATLCRASGRFRIAWSLLI